MGVNLSFQGEDISDADTIHARHKISCSKTQVVYKNTHKVVGIDSLFYKLMKFDITVSLNAMLDSDFLACTINEAGVITVL